MDAWDPEGTIFPLKTNRQKAHKKILLDIIKSKPQFKLGAYYELGQHSRVLQGWHDWNEFHFLPDQEQTVYLKQLNRETSSLDEKTRKEEEKVLKKQVKKAIKARKFIVNKLAKYK